jgi:predicted ATPase
LAQGAATVGRAFTVELLVEVSQQAEEAVVQGLDELWQRRIVREQGNARYDFSHDRIRDVAYAASSPVKRTLFHRRQQVSRYSSER